MIYFLDHLRDLPPRKSLPPRGGWRPPSAVTVVSEVKPWVTEAELQAREEAARREAEAAEAAARAAAEAKVLAALVPDGLGGWCDPSRWPWASEQEMASSLQPGQVIEMLTTTGAAPAAEEGAGSEEAADGANKGGGEALTLAYLLEVGRDFQPFATSASLFLKVQPLVESAEEEVTKGSQLGSPVATPPLTACPRPRPPLPA